MTEPRVLIIGAGIGGMTAALALLRAGVSVAVYEKAPELGEVGAGLSLGPNATKVLLALGLGPALAKVCNSPEKLCAKHYLTGEVIYVEDAVNHLSTYGAPYYQGHRADIHACLVDAVKAYGGDIIRLNQDFVGFEQDAAGVTAVFADGKRVRGEVLVACDGIKSVVRQQLWDPKPANFLGYVAYRGLVRIADLPPGLIVPSSSTFNGPQRHMTRYLIRGGTMVNYVAFTERTDWVDEGWSVPATTDEVMEHFKGWTEEVQLILRNTMSGRCHKWGLFGRDPLPQWTKDRVTLLGDAAHPMLPFLGQGASMAIEDAMLLGRALSAGGDLREGLRRYEDARRPRANNIVQLSIEQGKRRHSQTTSSESKKTALPTDIFAYDAVTAAV